MALNEPGPVGPPRFTIGGVIASSFTVLFSNILQFLAITVVIVAPAGGLIFLGAFLAQGLGDVDSEFTPWLRKPTTIVLLVYCAIVFLVGYSLLLAAITHGALQALRGERVGTGTALAQGFRILPKLFVAMLLIFVALGALLGGAGWAVYSVVSGSPVDIDRGGVAWVVVIVVVALVLFALVVVLTWVFVPAVVAERAGPIACFRRSLALTKGRRWAILAIVVLTGLVNGAESVLTDAIQAAGAPTVGEVLDLAFTAFITALSAVLSAVGYARLRGEKEGVVGEDVVKVFD
jgi:hypothetical protein